ncbi:hypothetical protein D9619_004534 [Psilocybe cf. subviscida]|uniref:Uncharacterized protein n=1 Tax=Psilocybe cf. subviscida TaxID=2480587 RepID=A0A8H5F8K8_9AGAR|nr:hypothetical protein D9619_004534 [Psilocybe cf. subviscida]
MIAAASLARLHTILASTAFLSALAIGCALHYKKITKNDVAQYPDEWFPSVSATIGDWFPERNLFQLLIALTSPLRFSLVFLSFYLNRSTALFLAGLVRTLSCGGWVYITSSDDHDVHDAMMVLYIVCNLPWMLGGAWVTRNTAVRRNRWTVASCFFATLVPLIYFFVQHKVHRIPGAYTQYAFCEWGLIFFDVLYDALSERDFKEAGLTISLLTSIPLPVTEERVPAPLSASSDGITSGPDKPLADALQAALAPAPPHTGDQKALLHSSSTSSPLRRVLGFAVDIYLYSTPSEFSANLRLAAFISWTLFTALIPSLFYFSVWKLGIAGHELAFAAVLSPALLSVKFGSLYDYVFGATAGKSTKSLSTTKPQLLALACTPRGQVILRLVSLLGLVAYIVPSPGGRLTCVFIASGAETMRAVVSWAGMVGVESGSDNEATDKPGYEGLTFGLALLLNSVLKMANRGNNPIWPFINHKANGWNNTGIILALLSIWEYGAREGVDMRNLFNSKHSVVSSATASSSVSTSTNGSTSSQHAQKRPSTLSVLAAALPLGSLLFIAHNLLADPASLIAWTWTGYENGKPRGPMPAVATHTGGHAWVVVAAMSLGLAIASIKPLQQLTRNPLWLAAGAAATSVLYSSRNWEGFYGGALPVALWSMSLLPATWAHAASVARQQAVNKSTGGTESTVSRVYTTAMGVYMVLNLASIFTVAYAFVPGGVYLRERTDLVLIAQTLCLLPLATWTTGVSPSSPTSTSRPASYTSHTLVAILLFFSSSLLVTKHRAPGALPIPYRRDTAKHNTTLGIVNAGIWAVHFGIDNEGHDSQRGMLGVIRYVCIRIHASTTKALEPESRFRMGAYCASLDMELDIVSLLETDLHRTAFGSRDLPLSHDPPSSRLLSEEGNYYVDIGPGPNAHTWGAVLLSKFPIISTKHHLLPSPHGELAPAIEAVLDIFGIEVLVLVSHNGQEEDPLDRELQATALAEIMVASTRPVIFLGYVVSKPHAQRPSPYGIMVNEGNVHDVDKDDLDRWCEYIFYRGLYRTSYARISRGIITDTETQIGQFVVPAPGHTVVDDSEPARYRRSRKEVLPIEHWFPMEYYGNDKEGGVNGHHYHVFGTVSFSAFIIPALY